MAVATKLGVQGRLGARVELVGARVKLGGARVEMVEFGGARV